MTPKEINAHQLKMPESVSCGDLFSGLFCADALRCARLCWRRRGHAEETLKRAGVHVSVLSRSQKGCLEMLPWLQLLKATVRALAGVVETGFARLFHFASLRSARGRCCVWSNSAQRWPGRRADAVPLLNFAVLREVRG